MGLKCCCTWIIQKKNGNSTEQTLWEWWWWWQMERKKKKSFHFLVPHTMFAFVKWLAEFKCSYYWGNFMTHLNLKRFKYSFYRQTSRKKKLQVISIQNPEVLWWILKKKNCSKIEKWKYEMFPIRSNQWSLCVQNALDRNKWTYRNVYSALYNSNKQLIIMHIDVV